MAVMLQPWLLLSLFFSVIHFSYCQPQNIETFYPFDLPSPAPPPSITNDPPTLTPLPPPGSPQLVPPPPLPPPPVQESPSNDRTIVTAVAATAASTLVVALLFFFGIQKYVIARRRREKVGDQSSHEGRPPAVVSANEFTRFDGNLKGLIVDENGLDVLYWRKLEEGDNKTNFHIENFHNPRHEEEKQAVQEVPLLRGKSSSSHIKIQPEEDGLDQIITSRPTPASATLKTIEDNEPPIQQSAVPPPPAPPIQYKKSPAPPPPPPPPPIPAKKNPAPPPPPPPPPIPANKNPAPPPPPPKAVGLATSLKPPPGPRSRSSESKEGESSAAVGNGNGQVKLKPLHWDKVNKNAEHSMVWDKIDGGSFRFDGDLMEALFGYVATNRKSPPRDNNSSSPSSPNSRVIIDARKSQNMAIVLKSLSLSRQELLDALLEGKELNAETLEKLARIAPSEEEQSQILNFDGDPIKLADAESFHYHILKVVPSAYTRINALLFRSNYDSEIIHLKETLQTLELGCKELRTRGLLLKLLEAILKAGNRMNAGTSRGNAQAFKLTALRKLSDVKSIDGKTTLLHFVVEEVVRSEGKRCVMNRNRSLSRSSSRNSNSSLTSENSIVKDEREKEYIMLGLPVVGGISAEFSNVKKAATIDYNAFSGSCSALSARTAEIREIVSKCAADGGGGFVKEMRGFLEAAEEELKVLRQEQTEVMELVKKTTEYYQASAAKQQGAHPLQLFAIIKDFLGMVDQVCVEIARNMQRRRTSMTGIGSSSPKSPAVRTVRFPNLPAHFLTDKSRSTSSESDSDS